MPSPSGPRLVYRLPGARLGLVELAPYSRPGPYAAAAPSKSSWSRRTSPRLSQAQASTTGISAAHASRIASWKSSAACSYSAR
jgi:hypothetical protein